MINQINAAAQVYQFLPSLSHEPPPPAKEEKDFLTVAPVNKTTLNNGTKEDNRKT